MNRDDCADFNDRLVDLVYGELPPEARERLEGHARVCSECGGTLEDLRATVRRLDGAAGGDVRVDTGRVLVAAAARAELSLRRWRLAGMAACAMLVVAAAFAAFAHRTAAPAPLAGLEATLDQHGERLAAVEELVRLVAVEVDSGGEQSTREVLELRRRLRSLEEQSTERWKRLGDDVRAVYHIAAKE